MRYDYYLRMNVMIYLSLALSGSWLLLSPWPVSSWPVSLSSLGPMTNILISKYLRRCVDICCYRYPLLLLCCCCLSP